MNAPRLTVARLDDLDEVVKTVDADITYLEGAIPTYAKDSELRARLVKRYNKLINGRNWIVGKLAAERNKENQSD